MSIRIWEFKVVLVLIGLVLISGCATRTIQTSAKNIKLAQDSIILTAKTADKMCSVGTLSEDQCRKAARLYSKSKDIYSLAIESELLFIEATLNKESGEDYRKIRDEAISDLYSIVTQLKGIVK